MRKRQPLFTTIYLSILSALVLLLSAKGLEAKSSDDNKRFGTVQIYNDDTSSKEFKQMIHRLDSFYKVQTRYGFNGSVLIGYKGKVLYKRYFGYANYKTKRKLTPNSAVQLASISKTFTATAVLYLYQHKYLDINKPVTTYLPNFPYKNITVKMLLNHRSGLPDYLKWYSVYNKDTRTPTTSEEVVALMAKHKPRLMYTPDTRFKYCNTNYLVLSRVIEEVTEMSYRDFMGKYVFEPLGMYNTFVYDPAWGLPKSATISYRSNWTPYADMFADGTNGDKGIYSTVDDMYKWDQSFYDNKLLSQETLEMAYGPCSFEKEGIRNYGLGWRMLCYPDGGKIIYHNGWWHGNNTVFHRNIGDNFTVIVLGNKFSNKIYHQVDAIYNIVTNSSIASEDDVEDMEE